MKDKIKAALTAAAITASAASAPAHGVGQDAGIRHFDYTYNYPSNVNLLGGDPKQTVNTSTLYFEKNSRGQISKIRPTSAFATAIDSEGYTVPSDNNRNLRKRAAVETYLSAKHYFEKHSLCRGTYFQGWSQIQKQKNKPSSPSDFMQAFGSHAERSVDFCPIFDARAKIAKEFKDQGLCEKTRDNKGRDNYCGVYLGRDVN